MCKIRIYNKSLPKNIYDKHYQEIYDIFENIMIKLGLDCKIKVRIVGERKLNFSKDYNASGCFREKNNSYQIDIYEGLIYELEKYDSNYNLYTITAHELFHLQDCIRIKENKYSNFIPNASCYKDYKTFAMSQGYNYWTEFYAYVRCFYAFKEKQAPTFFKLVRQYKQLKKISAYIEKNIDNRSKEFLEKCNELFEGTKNFIYFCAMFLAQIYSFKNIKYHYSDKTLKDKDFQYIKKFLNKLNSLTLKMGYGTYGKYMDKRLYNLGDYILDNIYIPLGFRVAQKRKKVGFVI